MSEKPTKLKEPELTRSAPSRVPDETQDNTQEHKPSAVELPGFALPKVEGEIGVLGKYRIQKLLGHGGMGAVYLAFDDRLQRKVALKVMLPKAATNELAKERFLREARAAAQVNSDYVVNIYEAEEIDGIPYIALQYLQGYPLDEYLKKKGLPSLKESMRIGKEMALGLAAAHELGLVHRDIKPGNIWLEAPKGRVKILDFGLAKPVENQAAAELTDSGALVGTPAYMSPEQGMGEKLDARTDLFSMGCVLYRIVTGKLPFDKPTLMGILTAIATEEPIPVQQHNPHVSAEFASLIHRLMAKKPANRPASATVVAKELQSLIQQFGQGGESKPLPKVVYAPMAVSLQQSNPFEDIDVETETVATKPKVEREKPKAKSSMLWLWVMLGFFGLLCCGAAGVIIIKITNKDGTVTELRVPEGTKIEVDGKTIKPEPKKPATVAGNSADRKVAEWVTGIGGRVRVNGNANDSYKREELPKENFRLTLAGLEHQASASDADMERFVECPQLQQVFLTRVNITDRGLATLLKNPSITEFVLNETRITNAGLAGFKGRKSLTWLYVAGTAVTDEGLAHLSECPNLQHIGFSKTKTTNAALNFFSKCEDLRSLEIDGTGITDEGLMNMSSCTKLMTIFLPEATTDRGLAAFKNCPELWTLNAEATAVTDKSVPTLIGFKKLHKLNIKGTKISAAKFEELKKAFPKCRIDSDFGVYDPTATFKNSLGMEFVKVPKGTGWLGGRAGRQGETKVVIEQDFYLGKYEVTQGEWEAVTGLNPSHFSRTGDGKDAVKDIPDADLKRFPVEQVSWDDCQLFIERLNEKEKDTGWLYRLPNLAEWEYACRGGPVDKLYSAFSAYFAKPTNKLLPEQANFASVAKRTCKVGSYEANLLGLYDMHGNVSEWYDDTEKAADGALMRIYMSCSWIDFGEEIFARRANTSSHRRSNIGLRLARVPVGPPSVVPVPIVPERKASGGLPRLGQFGSK